MIRCLVRLSLYLLVGLLPAVAQLAEEGADRMVMADGLFARAMYSLAAQEYEAILREEPDMAKADVVHFRLGECCRRLGKTLDADKHFGLVFKKYPQSDLRHRAGFRRAGLFAAAGYHDAAVDLYRTVLEAQPPTDVASACWYLLGESLLELERDDKAAKAFEHVVTDFPSSRFHAYARLKLGRLLVDRDDEAVQARARKLFQAVADNPPDPRLGAEGWFQVAASYYRVGQFDKSADAYRTLARKYSKDDRTLESRLRAAWAAHNAGRYANALGLCNARPDQAANEAEWLYLKANCLRQLLRHALAADTYRLLRKAYPASRLAQAGRYELALALYNDGKYEAAVDEATALVGGARMQEDIYWLLAESHAALNQVDKAVQYYRLVARDYPTGKVACEATYRLAYHLQARSDFVQAAEQFMRVADHWPEHDLVPRALFAAGYCWSQAESDDKAVAVWSRVVEEHSPNPLVEEAMFQKAMSEVRLRRDADALGSLRELHRRFPDSAFAVEGSYWEGRLLQQAEHYTDAEACLRRVLDAADTRPELKREAQLALAYVLQTLDKDQEAADRFQALLGTPAGEALSASVIEWLAQYRLQQQAYAKAVHAARRLVIETRTATVRQAGWYVLGRAYAGQGATADAVAAYENVLARGGAAPCMAEAALALGDAALAADNAAPAADYFERAATHDGASVSVRARAYAGQGRAARARGDLDCAARYFMTVAILYDDPVLVPDCLTQAAACLEAAGNPEGAARARAEREARYPDLETAE